MLSVKQVADVLGITPRAVTKKCKEAGLYKTGKSYQIPEEFLKLWQGKNNSIVFKELAEQKELNQTELKELTEPDTELKELDNSDSSEELFYEEFTQEQYDKLQEVITLYPRLEKELLEKEKEVAFLREQLSESLRVVRDNIKTLSESHHLQFIDKTNKR